MPKSSIFFIIPIFRAPKSLANAFSKLTTSRFEHVESFSSYDAIASSNAAQPKASLAKGPA